MMAKIRCIDDFLVLLQGVKQIGKNRWMASCPWHGWLNLSLNAEASGHWQG